MSCETEEIRFFAANIVDLSKLNPVQLLLVKDKIEDIPFRSGKAISQMELEKT